MIAGVFGCGMMQFLYPDHVRGEREVGREVGSGGSGQLVGV